MAKDSQSTLKNKDDENINSKGRHLNDNSSTTVGPEALATPDRRRSARESSSKKAMSPSPASTRKSERLGKQTPTPPPAMRKSLIVKKHIPNALRRSERGKKRSSSSSSGSKKSEKSSASSDAKKDKETKEKFVKRLTLEMKESEKQDTKPARIPTKNIKDARAYKALFMQNGSNRVNATDQGKKLDNLDMTDTENPQGWSSKPVHHNDDYNKTKRNLAEEYIQRPLDAGLEDSCSSLNEKGAGMSISNPELIPAEKAIEVEDGDCLQTCKSDGGGHVDCTVIKKMGSPELVESTLIGTTDDTKDSLLASHKVASIKRKGSMLMDLDLDLEGEGTNTCGTCLKRRRVDSVSTKQGPCSCKTFIDDSEDRGRLEEGVITAVVQTCDRDSQPPVDIQTDGDQNICLLCKLGGELLCCNGRGCKQRYHLSCLDPSLEDVPLGLWHCLGCTEKRIKHGVHAISKLESIWDVKELYASNGAGGFEKQKHFFVKYKGFSHVHNRWVRESQLFLEDPQLIAKFNQESLVAKWKREWIVPHRLLQKRLLMPLKQHGEGLSERAGGTSVCHYEWLVKWHGLGYEDATWELENSPFLSSPEGRSLVSGYESRHMKAKKDSLLSKADKRTDRMGVRLTKLPHLPIGSSSRLDNSNILDIVNKLRELLRKEQNAVIIDDQEQISKVIMFLVSLQLDMSRPFLIITSSDALCSWASEFSCLAPSVNVVVYSGNKDLRKRIRSLEFFEESGCLMLEVLVSPIEVIVEDLEVLDCIGWEGIIVDDCQHSRICAHSEKIKMLTSDMRLLLVRGQLKDDATECLKMLSLLDSSTDLCNTNGLKISSNDSSGKLRERLSKYIANEDKDVSRFVEYWVPVWLSNIQLEQYCATLLSNSTCLQSSSRIDPVGALRDTLISTRKCCDHPYILDPSLQGSLTLGLQPVEVLDFGIKASGKLQLLESMLVEIKNKGLRVLILYQSISGFGRDSISIGDILDDFMRLKFGVDSYERVDGLGASAKSKQAALNNFNKECGRFVFLLETRACLPSIKLSSVDAVIIFGSDWAPVNDIRALQRITMDSQSKQTKVFRLYSSYTVEEKNLMLEKHEMTHNNLPSCTTNQKLLMWGASYLFNKLDEFHGCCTAGSSASAMTEHFLFRNVLQEFSTILDQSGIKNCASKSILKVKLNGLTYSGPFSLLGEREIQLTDEELPQVFWKKLLEGKHPQWKYQPTKSSSLRNRKRPPFFSELPDKLEVVNESVPKKRKNMVSNSIDLPTLNPGVDEGNETPGSKEGGSRIPVHEYSRIECEGGRKVCDAQKSLHLLLKPEVFKLCETLQLSEDIKGMVDKFLEYVMTNHSISGEPLQAFQISLCWIAASLLKKKIDPRQSLALAEQHLNFCCNEEEATYVYLKLRCLKHMFYYRTGYLKIASSPRASSLSSKDEPFCSPNASNHQREDNVDQALSIRKLVERDILISIKRLQKKYEKQLSTLTLKEDEEVNELCRIYEEEKAELEKKHKTELAVIRCLDKSSAGADRLKMLENAFARKVEQHQQQSNRRLEDLMKMQLSARKKVEQKYTFWEDKIKSWSQVELLDRLLSDESGSVLEYLQTSAQSRVRDGNVEKQVKPMEIPEADVQPDCPNTEKVFSVTPLSSGKQNSSVALLNISDEEVRREILEIGNVREGVHINKEINSVDDMAPNATCSDQRNGGGSINQDYHLQELCPGDAPLAQSESTLPQGRVLHRSQALQDQCPLPSISTEIQNGDEPSTKEQQSTGQGEALQSHPNDYVVPSGCNCEAPLSSAGEIGQPPSDRELNGASADVQSNGNHNASVMETFQGPVLKDRCSLPSVSTETRDEDAPSSKERHDTEQVEAPQSHQNNDDVPNDCNFRAPTSGPVLQSQLPLTDTSPNQNPVDMSSAGEIGHLPSMQEQSVTHSDVQFDGDYAASVMEPLVHLSPIDLSSGHNAADLPSSGGTEYQTRTDHYLPSGVETEYQPSNGEQNVTAETEPPPQSQCSDAPLSDHRIQEAALIREPVVQLQVSAPVESSSGHIPLRTSRPLGDDPLRRQIQTAHVSRSPLPFSLDPLHNELDRVGKDRDLSAKMHEDMKLQLKADCDKEIEEVVAQIRNKYEIKLQESEVEYSRKKKEMDASHNKVLMNKILAEAFRCKCMDGRASGASGMRQDTVSSFRQQLAELHQNGQRVRLPLVTSTQHSPATSPRSSTPIRPPAASLQQPVFHSRPLASAPAISPFTVPIPHPAVSRQGGSEIRAPAPHLQRFRPPASLPSSNSVLPLNAPSTPSSSGSLPPLPRRIPSQQAHCRMPSQQAATHLSSTSLPPLPRRTSPPASLSRPPLPSSMPTHPTPPASSDVYGAALPDILSPLPDLGANLDQVDLSGASNVAPAPAPSSDGVVCLSDDD